jgi:hypothetical protein
VKEKKTARFRFLQCRLRATCSRVFLAKKEEQVLRTATSGSHAGSWLLDGNELPATGWRVTPPLLQGNRATSPASTRAMASGDGEDDLTTG